MFYTYLEDEPGSGVLIGTDAPVAGFGQAAVGFGSVGSFFQKLGRAVKSFIVNPEASLRKAADWFHQQSAAVAVLDCGGRFYAVDEIGTAGIKFHEIAAAEAARRKVVPADTIPGWPSPCRAKLGDAAEEIPDWAIALGLVALLAGGVWVYRRMRGGA